MELEQEPVGKLESLEAVLVRLPLLHPFETSFGVWTVKEALLLRLRSESLESWSECVASPEPFFSCETNVTALHILKDFLVPVLRRAKTVRQVLDGFRHVRGHNMAKAALENALVDLIARRKGVPLHELLGGERKRIKAGVSFGIAADTGELLERIAGVLERRFHKVKLKIKRGKDEEVLRRVRERFPQAPLAVDANADYTLADAEALARLDGFGLMMIEQPLAHDDLYQHSLLQKRLHTPICLDESVESLEAAQAASDMVSCRIINIKQGRVGGLFESRRIEAFSRENGIGVWSGGMLETGIGRGYNLHLQTLPGFVYPGDNSGIVRAFAEDLTEPAVSLDGEGTIGIPEGAGTAFQVVAERVDRLAVGRETLF